MQFQWRSTCEALADMYAVLFQEPSDLVQERKQLAEAVARLKEAQQAIMLSTT